MPPRKVSPPGSEYFRVRITIPNALIHLASATRPELRFDGGRLVGVVADWLDDPEAGDTLGYIDWRAVTAITWRYSGKGGGAS